MSKPLYFIVFEQGQDPKRFTARPAARAYAAARRLLGYSVIIKPVGF